MSKYFASIAGNASYPLNAKTLLGAKREATKIFGAGFRGLKYSVYRKRGRWNEQLCWKTPEQTRWNHPTW